MHYNGPIIRPQTDAYSVFLEVTVGCTHNSCKFCNFYQGYPFNVASFQQIEEDLQEAASFNPHAKKVWASGGNPYALSIDHLSRVAKLVKKYLPESMISTYARVNDFEKKSVDDIRYLKTLGYEDIVIGIESADDEVLTNMDKGYTSTDILRELKKVEEAGVSYRIIYLGGLAGADKCEESARKTAEVLNQLHPYMMLLTTVAVIPRTRLYDEMKKGDFKEASELERIKEFRTLVNSLENEIVIFAETSTDMVGFTAQFPQDKKHIVGQLDEVIANFTDADEKRFHARRKQMVSV
jgi:radical SAM superfamily enzyme YgiQ (UPF0313 family)